MNETDLNNIKLISTIVENHFGLTKNSFDFFNKELNNTTLDPYFQDLFAEHKSTDLRVRYKIPQEICSTIDNGWKYFVISFFKFIEKYDFNYSNFITNKITIEKNSIKTRKALISFYTQPDNFMAFRKDLYSKMSADLRNQEVRDWETKKIVTPNIVQAITDYIDSILNTVSQRCLPKIEIQLVLTCNFADWFLCSTAESWKSCLNLESEFHTSYWAGLPGLLGDKNRCMLYITDGTKKTYQGITVDKIIARSWGLLSDANFLSIIKPYPLADIFDAPMVSTLTNLKTKTLTSTEFISKNPVELLYLDDIRTPSSFIYQDNSGFTEDLYIKVLQSGFYSFINGQLRRGEAIINYTSGLINLIQRKESLKQYIIKKLTCLHCGHTSEAVKTFMVDGQSYTLCPTCLKENFKKCTSCNEYHLKSFFTSVCDTEGEFLICNNCLERKYSKCEMCNKYHKKSSLLIVYDTFKNKSKMCFKCIETIPDIICCDRCGSYMPANMIQQANLIGTEFMCDKCLQNYTDQKQIFFDFMIGEPIQYINPLIYAA